MKAAKQYYHALIFSNQNDTKNYTKDCDLINLKCKNWSPLPQVLKLMTLSKLQMSLINFFQWSQWMIGIKCPPSSGSFKFTHYTKSSFFLHEKGSSDCTLTLVRRFTVIIDQRWANLFSRRVFFAENQKHQRAAKSVHSVNTHTVR